jgi:hypothetical protein
MCFTLLHMNKHLSPPKPPRVSVPVTAEVLDTFERLAKAGNMSTGRAMAEWLADTVEAAELMASVMEHAKASPKLVTAELHAMMLGMTEQSKELERKFAKFKGPLGPVERAASGVQPPQPGRRDPIPPSCNTGGKVPEEGSRKRGGKS